DEPLPETIAIEAGDEGDLAAAAIDLDPSVPMRARAGAAGRERLGLDEPHRREQIPHRERAAQQKTVAEDPAPRAGTQVRADRTRKRCEIGGAEAEPAGDVEGNDRDRRRGGEEREGRGA